MKHLTVEIDTTSCAAVLVPNGIGTPYDKVVELNVIGGHITRVLSDAELGLSASLAVPDGAKMTVRYGVETAASGDLYPEAAFAPRQNQFTRAAAELATESRRIAEGAGRGQAGIEALVAEAESRFSYAHPEHRFTDGMDMVPYLSCGLTPGSCVDINTYLVAALRAAGYDAAYFYGYFFPEERAGITLDGHCWVATRHEGEILEWDIAHHIKTGLGATKPGLNPRPGKRVAISHSMGHRYGDLCDGSLIKILGEPLGLNADLRPVDADIIARLEPWT
ncbi:transglutaminase-like domain-containing protein [Phaeobacter sp. J2-8]|uniref:transglutaminase-like domain-containing protein n=1 Tax=Phaeobacter sp. J2-8 TaxID=2931394 RepID=UPI001FD33BD4|nr:transglutaminase-like domain-containing protein [Phaeobacter sp. J2-8]MCJ7874867.1 transglutaminase-like domain-containing protein [Phaeobacter sp. J2-8]